MRTMIPTIIGICFEKIAFDSTKTFANSNELKTFPLSQGIGSKHEIFRFELHPCTCYNEQQTHPGSPLD